MNGRQLAKYRFNADVKGKDVAEYMDVSKSAISAMERRISIPEAKVVKYKEAVDFLKEQKKLGG
ncbi:MAG: helix-turn-helix domain-containing protein [Aestuariibacter sp.]|nr:helix-turn-helix domain-containing protein [Aestuariibacter sp.]